MDTSVDGSGSLSADTTLLDIGSYIAQAQDESPAYGAFSLIYYPTCGEAVALWQPHGDSEKRRPLSPRLDRSSEDHAGRNGRRARTAVRRIALHNDLGQMLTFTYREGVPRDLDKVPEHFRMFWQRYRRATGLDQPHYVIVPEWGTLTKRLHFHMGISWWDSHEHTNACTGCASPALKREWPHLPKEGDRLCVGCLWRLGHVYPPKTGVQGAIPSELASYCVKYMEKSIGEGESADGVGVGFGRHRYRASKGAAPIPERFDVEDLEHAVTALTVMGGKPIFAWAPHLELDGYEGAPVVVFRFPRQGPQA